MPISKKQKLKYHYNWKAISLDTRVNRAKNKCEICGISNGSLGLRNKEGDFYTVQEIEDYLNKHGIDLFEDELIHHIDTKTGVLKKENNGNGGFTKIVLTVAHLDHNPVNNDYSNLSCLCQYHHLQHDLVHHLETRKKNKMKNDKQISMFEEIG
jgi:hypothetical protein